MPAPARRSPRPFATLLIGAALFCALGVAMAPVPHLASRAQAADQRPPYWASINRPRAIMRRGPSSEMRAMWEYRRIGLPLRILEIHDDWRRVEDPEGVTGWMHKRLLSGRRTAIVIGTTPQPMRISPATDAGIAYRAEPGVIGQLTDCANNWCQLDVEGRSGWVSTDSIWGD